MKKLAIAVIGLALLLPAMPANAHMNTSIPQNTKVSTSTVNKEKVSGTTDLKLFSNSFNALPSSKYYPEYFFNGLNKNSGAIYVQEYKNGKWSNVQTVKRSISSGKLNIAYNVPVRNAGITTYYRLHHPETAKVKSWSTVKTKVTYNTQKLKFEYPNEVFQNTEKRWMTNVKNNPNQVYAKWGAGVKVNVQQKVGSQWKNVSTYTLNNDGYARASIRIPAVKNAGTYTYRLYANKGKYTSSATSKSVTVKVEDPRKYTGLKKASYNYAKKYCPNVIIDTAKPNNKWIGQAKIYERKWSIVTGLSARSQKFTSLHECAHIIEGEVYPNWDELVKKSNKVYGAKNGIEQLADCMAIQMGASIHEAYYTKKCTGARKAMATSILKGKKY